MCFEESLINLVKDYEYLYNTKLRTYKNSTKKTVTWDAISKTLNRSDCKQRWRSLRDRFNREHGTMTSLPSGSGAVFDGDDKWEYYDLLEFLIPSLSTRNQIGNWETSRQVNNANDDLTFSSHPILPVAVDDVVVTMINDEGGQTIKITPVKSRAVKRKAAGKTFKIFMDGLNTSIAYHLVSEPTADVDMEFMQNTNNND